MDLDVKTGSAVHIGQAVGDDVKRQGRERREVDVAGRPACQSVSADRIAAG